MPRIFSIRQLALAVAALAIFGVGTAKADVVYLGPITLGGQGIGSVATILSIQNTGFESGSIAWNGTTDVGTGNLAAGGNNQTRTLSELGVTTNGSQLRIIFNINETGAEGTDTGFVLLHSLTVTVYGNNGAVLGTFSYDGAPLELSQSSGIGGSGHAFGLDAAQAAALTALITTHGAGNLRIGVNASVGCLGLDTDPRHCTDDGFETFNGGSVAAPIPEPTTMLLLGTGLLGLAGAARRRLKK